MSLCRKKSQDMKQGKDEDGLPWNDFGCWRRQCRISACSLRTPFVEVEIYHSIGPEELTSSAVVEVEEGASMSLLQAEDQAELDGDRRPCRIIDNRPGLTAKSNDAHRSPYCFLMVGLLW